MVFLTVRGLLLVGAKSAQLSVRFEQVLHPRRAQCARQLVFEVGVAGVEAECFEIGTREIRAEAGASQPAREMALLRRVVSCRWGARTYGTASYDEFGLFRLSEDEAQAWADRYFVADNAVLFMTGEPPEGFSLELPRGERHSLPSAEWIELLQLPTGISVGQGAVGVGMEVDRSAGTGLALTLLTSAATARLRHELGVTYHVGSDYQLAGPDSAHLTIAADCLDTNAEQVASTLLAVIDNLASTGPEEAELELERERFQRAIRAPADALDWFATGDLIGITREKLLEQISLTDRISGEDVAAVIQGGADRMILIVPSHMAPPDRCRPYPHFSERAVSGAPASEGNVRVAIRAPGRDRPRRGRPVCGRR